VTIIPLLAQALYDLERCQMLLVVEDRKNLGMAKLISYKATTKKIKNLDYFLVRQSVGTSLCPVVRFHNTSYGERV